MSEAGLPKSESNKGESAKQPDSPEVLEAKDKIKSTIIGTLDKIVDELPPGWKVDIDELTKKRTLTRQFQESHGSAQIVDDRMLEGIETKDVDDTVVSFYFKEQKRNQEVDSLSIQVTAEGSVKFSSSTQGIDELPGREASSIDELQTAQQALDQKIQQLFA